MENVNISVSLTATRWRKTTKRLKAMIDECIQIMLHAFKSARAQVYLGPAQIAGYERLRVGGFEAKECLGRLLQTRSQIRNAIARHNADAGIYEILAEIEANKQRITLFREILKYQHAGRVPLDRIETVFLDAGKGEHAIEASLSYSTGYETLEEIEHEMFKNGGRSVGDGIDVAVLTPAEVDALRQEREALERRNFQLHDMLVDANLKRVSLEVPADLAKRLAIA